jgi:glycosyltransferase involved in cell wall biosynthesis
MSRIAIVTPSTDETKGGVERFAVQVAGIAERAGHSVSVVSPRTTRRAAGRLGLGPLVESARARSQVKATKPDLVITNGALGATFGRRFPRIHVYHGVTLARWRILPPTDRLRFRLRYTAQLATAELLSGFGAYRVTVSDRTAREVGTFLHFEVHKVIENGVDTQLFKPSGKATARRLLGLPLEQRIALTVGGNEYRKGADIFLGACHAAGWLPVCAGTEIPGAINLGRLSSEKLALAYSAGDAVIFASRYEAASLALLEALACGAIPLVSNVGSVGSLLDRLPSFSECLVEVDEPSVAEKLRQLAESPARFARSAEAASDLVRRDHSLQRLEQEWTSLLGASIPDSSSRPPDERSRGRDRARPSPSRSDFFGRVG